MNTNHSVITNLIACSKINNIALDALHKNIITGNKEYWGWKEGTKQ